MDATARQLERETSDLRALATARLRQGDREGAHEALMAESQRLLAHAEKAAKEAEIRLLNARICRATDPEYRAYVDARIAAIDECLAVWEEIKALRD